jgi:hypothetical protein
MTIATDQFYVNRVEVGILACDIDGLLYKSYWEKKVCTDENIRYINTNIKRKS